MEHAAERRRTIRKRGKLTPYLFISPWIVGFVVFTAGPLILSLVMSLFDWPVTSAPKFVGFENFIKMFTKDPQFYKSLVITLKFAVFYVPLSLATSLILALLIAQPVRGAKAFRTIFYLPAVVSGVAVSIIWGWIFNTKYGILNYALSLFGIQGPKWLIDPASAIMTIVIASAWGVGTMMLIFYTNIKSISPDLYESAAMDGAGFFRQFTGITLPLITPTLFFNLITSTISALQQLTLVLLLTNGGPLKSTYFYGLFVYNNAFKHHKLGYASANAWFMFIIILLLTALIFKSSSVWVFYENDMRNERKRGGGKK
ncbi:MULTISPECIES: carbohydrate ABC transporter permease [unclassified Paenibacillus]|uniref:carbohydrate ABC transporter permease n=1 Tax=unclassified Paenibacillus TaxID=185978 RepID=UPI001C103E3C|nr:MULTISPECIES: sugar ABC transporter permease [unclassified Paenibacillus]MBU5442509.1 sugar ABC transporter permease [Paenibacillus sp. MSJ-34]CAH0122091.1 Lactose transport system permease protein LacF [Paenibacillus sp. CECT 9249]